MRYAQSWIALRRRTSNLASKHGKSVGEVVLCWLVQPSSLGHEIGDDILVQIANRLKGCVGATDMLARLGGDEFALVMEDVDRCAVGAEQLAERINAALKRTIPVGGRELYLTVSTGIALFHRMGWTTRRCCATLIPPCTAPRRPSAMAGSFSTVRWRAWSGMGWIWKPDCGMRSNITSSASTINPSVHSRTAALSGQRRWYAGNGLEWVRPCR
jgi:hypothetical protein